MPTNPHFGSGISMEKDSQAIPSFGNTQISLLQLC